MPIVSSSWERGIGHVVVRHTDNMGVIHQHIFFCPQDWDQQAIAAKVSQDANLLEQSLAEAEFEQVIG
jgi:hypothetical protein